MASKKRIMARFNVEIKGPTKPLAIRWSNDGPIIYVVVSNAEVARTREVADDVLADYDSDGALVGFEVLGAGRPREVEIPIRLGTAEETKSEKWELVGAGAYQRHRSG